MQAPGRITSRISCLRGKIEILFGRTGFDQKCSPSSRLNPHFLFFRQIHSSCLFELYFFPLSCYLSSQQVQLIDIFDAPSYPRAKLHGHAESKNAKLCGSQFKREFSARPPIRRTRSNKSSRWNTEITAHYTFILVGVCANSKIQRGAILLSVVYARRAIRRQTTSKFLAPRKISVFRESNDS